MTLTKSTGRGSSYGIPRAELWLYGNSERLEAFVQSSDCQASDVYPRQRAHFLFTTN